MFFSLIYLRFTASILDELLRCKDPTDWIPKNMWRIKDLSWVPSIKHGNDYEKIAIKAFEEEMNSNGTPGNVQFCGLHISKDYPHIGMFIQIIYF